MESEKYWILFNYRFHWHSSQLHNRTILLFFFGLISIVYLFESTQLTLVARRSWMWSVLLNDFENDAIELVYRFRLWNLWNAWIFWRFWQVSIYDQSCFDMNKLHHIWFIFIEWNKMFFQKIVWQIYSIFCDALWWNAVSRVKKNVISLGNCSNYWR